MAMATPSARMAIARPSAVLAHATRMRAARSLATLSSGSRASTSAAAPAPPGKFGTSVASEGSAAQNMSDISRGRYNYISDFMASMQRGPVKLEFGDRAPTAKELEQLEAQERALKMMQRSMAIGTLLAFGGVYVGWVLSKRALGVTDAKEFSEAMKHKMPKVSGDMEDSMVGRRLKQQSAASRDAISEDPELTAWRRSLRDKFNTPEGKALARKNSVLMAEKRKQERVERDLKGDGMAINTSRAAPVNPEVVALVADAKQANETRDATALDDTSATVQPQENRVVPRSEANKLKRRASVSWAGGATGSSSGWAQRGPN